MGLNLIFVRHGETAWNAEKRMQGHLDVPLNAVGERQARAAGRRLAVERIDAVLSSDLSRAHQTALAIAAPHGLAVVSNPVWRERCFGSLQGLCASEAESRFPEAHRAWQQRDRHHDLGGGESLLAFQQRINAALDDLPRQHSGATLVVVAHGGVLDCVYRRVCRMAIEAPRDWPLTNASINRIHWSPEHGFAVLAWGQTDHLNDSQDEWLT